MSSMDKLFLTRKGLTFNIDGLFVESIESGYGKDLFSRVIARTTSGISLEVSGFDNLSKYFKDLTYYPNPPHKHAELIKAWAEGAEIEFKNFVDCWVQVNEPSWLESYQYRIKPCKSDKDIEIENIQKEMDLLNQRLGKLKESK